MNNLLKSFLVLVAVLVIATGISVTKVSAQCTGPACATDVLPPGTIPNNPIPTTVQPIIPPCANCNQVTPPPTNPTTPPGNPGNQGGPGDGRSDGQSSCPDCTKAHNDPGVQSVLGLSATGSAKNGYFEIAQLLGVLGLSLASYKFFIKNA